MSLFILFLFLKDENKFKSLKFSSQLVFSQLKIVLFHFLYALYHNYLTCFKITSGFVTACNVLAEYLVCFKQLKRTWLTSSACVRHDYKHNGLIFVRKEGGSRRIRMGMKKNSLYLKAVFQNCAIARNQKVDVQDNLFFNFCGFHFPDQSTGNV